MKYRIYFYPDNQSYTKSKKVSYVIYLIKGSLTKGIISDNKILHDSWFSVKGLVPPDEYKCIGGIVDEAPTLEELVEKYMIEFL